MSEIWPPVLLASRPRWLQLAILFVGPIVFGVFCGWLVSASKTDYLIATTVGTAFGLAAGYEHNTVRGGALRGLWGGVVFGLSIALTYHAIDHAAAADVPDPIELLMLLFGAISTALGVIGAVWRRRNERRAAAALA